jgi:hypothetical protein
MIRVRVDLTRLPEDNPAAAACAYARGWRIDTDLWWVRALRDADAPDVDRADWFICTRHVYAPDAETAIAFDQAAA